MRTLLLRAAALLAASMIFVACGTEDSDPGDAVVGDTSDATGDTSTTTDTTEPDDTTGPDDTTEPGDTALADTAEPDVTDTVEDVEEDTAPMCDGTEVLCGDSCVDTMTSATHCGACDAPCQMNETCNAGICEGGGLVSFSAQVEPILNARCATCHGAGLYDKWVGQTSSCSAQTYIEPGDAEASYVVHKIERAPACGGAMPPGAPLAASDVTLIKTWIDEGALDN